MTDLTETLKSLAQDETVQRIFAQCLFVEVLRDELKRRKLPEQLLTMQDLAYILDVELQSLYKKFQKKEIAIRYICVGTGGQRRFDPSDVKQWLRENKVTPVVRPASLKQRNHKEVVCQPLGFLTPSISSHAQVDQAQCSNYVTGEYIGTSECTPVPSSAVDG